MGGNLLISAGEASGDIHGARLLEALRRREPGLTAFGMGGPRLEAAGLERVVRSDDLSVVGIFEVFEKLGKLRRALKTLTEEGERRLPDAAVIIDFPDFHGFLTRRLARIGIPLIYYVSPQVWAWRSGRAAVIARRARRMITLFPFEVDIYRRLGADAVWAGHPLVDDVREALAAGPEPPLKTKRRLVLLPGSRTAEIRRHWPVLSEAATRLASRYDLEPMAVRAPWLPEDLFVGAGESGIRLVTKGMHRLLTTADLALAVSGTVTLEAALCGAPMVVVYKASPASMAIGKMLIDVPWITLANIVTGEEVVPELIQEEASAENLVREAGAILESPERTARMKEGLARAAEKLGPPGASDRAAEAVLEVVTGSRSRDISDPGQMGR